MIHDALARLKAPMTIWMSPPDVLAICLAGGNADIEMRIHRSKLRVDGFVDALFGAFSNHDEGTLAQMRNCMGVGDVVAGVICADGHLGYAQPVGGIIAYEGQISISGVGFDIGCGNMAVRLDVPFTAIADRIGPIIKDVSRIISFGVGRTNEERVEHALFDDAEPGKPPTWATIARRRAPSSAPSARETTTST
jgi:tRNA-splicing ligase RtcB